jgi:hypothetical protein
MKLKNILYENTKQVIGYHGTSFEFDTFITKRGKSGYGYSMGAYFTDNKSEAIRYGKNVRGYKLTFKNILDLTFIKETDTDGKAKFFNYMRSKYSIGFKIECSLIYNNPYFGYTTLETLDRNANLVPLLKRRGIDGIAFNEGNGITYVVFNSNQIKSK